MAMVTHHRFSVAAYHRMISEGILSEDDPVELIRGEIIEKMPVGATHAAAVKRLNRIFAGLESVIVSVQDPILLDDSEPEPDLALLRYRDDFYAGQKPTAADVRLLIEVADSSLAYDRQIKLPLYARAKIGEVWIVDLIDTQVEVYRDPNPEGDFASRSIATRGDRLGPTALEGWSLDVEKIFR